MTEIKLNKLSGHDKFAKVGKILVKENQDIKTGDVLFNVESSKGNFKVKSEYDGKVLKVLVEEGKTVKIGDIIIHLDGEKSSAANKNNFSLGVSKSKKIESKYETALTSVNSKKTYSFGISKPKKEEVECDVAVIGGGPGGYVAAIRAAQLGANVTLIEKHKLGGTCLNYGCIPTKSFVKSAHLYDEILKSEEFGILVENPKVDMNKIVDRKDGIVSTLVGGIDHLLKSWNIKHINGEAKVDNEVITVKNKNIDVTIKAKNTVLAVGSSAVRLNIPGADLEKVLTNKEILEIKEIPKSLTIVGGGIIGMEFAFIFNSLGSDVTVIEYMDRILNTMDDDIIDIMEAECEKKGIRLYTSSKVEKILETDNKEMITEFNKNDSSNYVIGDYVLMSVGRRPNLDSIDLEKINVKLNEIGNGIKVDEKMVTSNEKIYAIGDVTNIIQLAHVASHQGIVAVENIMGMNSKMSYDAVPSAVFVTPEIGTVGMSEKEAKDKGIDYKIGKFPFAANGKALTLGETEGFVKVIADEDDAIIGAAVIGPGATDMIANFTFLIENKINHNKLSHTIFAHPTTAEAIHEAILSLKDGAIHFA